QQLSRWTFNEDKTGSVLEQDDTFTACHIAFQSNINYQYNPKTGEIVINYLTGQDTGKISDVTDTTMNLKIEEIDLNADTYESQVYTMVRVNLNQNQLKLLPFPSEGFFLCSISIL